MANKTFTCPSCGAPVELKYRFTKTVVCPYCNVTSYIVGNTIEAKGKNMELANYGSKLYLGAEVSILNKNYKVLGRIRFTYPDGFWDEWLLHAENDPDSEYWLHEDEGDYVLFIRQDISEIPDFQSTVVGQNYQFGDITIFISDKNTANIGGSEGELSFHAIPGEKADFIDGLIYGKENTMGSFEYLPNENLFFIGQVIDIKDIIVKDKENVY